jgi:hypothetical protein
LKTARLYCSGEEAFAREKNGKVILTFVSEAEGGGEWVEREDWLSSLILVRSEIARGDLRCLYLGWLLCVQNRELDEEDVEPPVPPGLGQLSASLESMVDFLRIDLNLIYVAARASEPLEDATPKQEEILEWIGTLPAGEKDDVLAQLIANEDLVLAKELFRRFIKERGPGSQQIAQKCERRTIGELLQAAAEHAEELRRAAAKKAAEERARRNREVAEHRAKYLDEIAKRAPNLWDQVGNLISTKQPKSYDQAVRLLIDLRDLAFRKGKMNEFGPRLSALHAAQARKPSFIKRLRKAGL